MGALAAGDLPLAGTGVAFPVIVIADGDDPAADGDVHAFQPFGIAAAIPVLMMVEDDFHDMGKSRDVFQHAGSSLAMPPVSGPFPDIEIGIFGQDGIGDGKLPYVMEEGGCLDAAHFVQGEPHFDGCGRCVIGYLLAVEEQAMALQLQQFQEPLDDFLGICIRGEIQELGNGDHRTSTFASKVRFALSSIL